MLIGVAYPLAIRCSTFTHDSDLVKVATSEASTLVMISILPETKQVMMCFPPAVSFLYNAATLLLGEINSCSSVCRVFFG